MTQPASAFEISKAPAIGDKTPTTTNAPMPITKFAKARRSKTRECMKWLTRTGGTALIPNREAEGQTIGGRWQDRGQLTTRNARWRQPAQQVLGLRSALAYSARCGLESTILLA